MKVPIKNIPTYDAVEKTWSKTSFDDQAQFADFLTSIYKDCGEYDFDETTTGWNALGTRYTQVGSYTDLPKGSQGRKNFWDE